MSYSYIDIRPNPVTGIGSHQRGFKLRDFVDLPEVEHRRIGGPYKATFRIYANDRNMAEELLFLGAGQEVKIYNDKGIVDFGGMIYVVTLSTGGSRVRSSLLETSNRAWARWQEAGTANPPDRSTKYDNAASQALYGIKEEVWNAGQQVTVAEASQYAEKQLQEYAWPTPRVTEISPGKKLSGRPLLDITCYGWWHTLSHVRYNQTVLSGGISASALVEIILGVSDSPTSLKNNLESWWTMDEPSAGLAPVTRVDSHGANDLADINTTASAAAKVNLGADLELTNNEYLRHADNASLSTGDIDFTIACWIKAESLGASAYIMSKWGLANNREYSMFYTIGFNRFQFYVSNNGVAAITVTANILGAPAIATWYLIICWHDSVANTINIQVNDGGIDSVGHATGVFNGASNFTIGADHAGLFPFDGIVDEAAFWKRILTATERAALYNAGSGVGYGNIGRTQFGEAGQFLRSANIEPNGTQIEQKIDADMGADAIIKSIVDMGDPSLNTWVAGVDHTREIYYRTGELAE